MKKKQRERKPLISSLPFISTAQGSKQHRKHNKELEILYNLLRKAGVKDINTRHIKPIGVNQKIPIKIGKTDFDLSYISMTGRIVMLELKWQDPE